MPRRPGPTRLSIDRRTLAAASGLRLPVLALVVSLGLGLGLGFGTPAAQAQSAITGQSGEAAKPSVSAAEAVDRLLAVIEDAEARQLLVERLAGTGTGSGPAAGAAAGAAATEVDDSFARQIATATAEGLREGGSIVQRAWADLTRLELVIARIARGDSPVPLREAVALLGTIVSTILLHQGLAVLVRRRGRRLRPRPGTAFRLRSRYALAQLGLRVGALLVSWIFGVLVATGMMIAAPEARESVQEAQSYYLNAFLLFGLARDLLHLFVSPDADREPGLSQFAPGAQTIIYRRVRAIAGVLLHGFLFLVPLAHLWLGFVAARSLRTLAATLAAVLALVAVRRIHRAMRLAHGDRELPVAPSSEAFTEGAQALWRRIWPGLTAAYVLYAWFVMVGRPALAERLVLGGTLEMAVALGMLLLSLRALRSAPHLRAPLPDGIEAAMPRLRPRANFLTQACGWVAALALLIGAVALGLQSWGVLALWEHLARSEVQAVLWRIASALMVLLAAGLSWALVVSWIDFRLTTGLPGRNVSARTRTLLALFRNAFSIALAILGGAIALSQLGLNVGPLIAGAGVIGLAIGFGSQKLVQDIITGIFIQLENAINEGDVVEVAGIAGAVEKLTIRSVTLRSADGAAHIVPFSAVTTVSNMTRDFAYHVADIGVAYKESVEGAKAAMEEAFRRLRAEPFDADILDGLDMQGVTMLGDSAVTIRARIKTRPGKQWGVGRRYTELVKMVMDERGIEIPFPHRTVMIEGAPMLSPAAPPVAPVPGAAGAAGAEIPGPQPAAKAALPGAPAAETGVAARGKTPPGAIS